MLWDNPLHKTDLHADDLQEFCVQNDLLIVNDETSEITFESVRSDRWIDLVLSKLSRSITLISWEVELSRERQQRFIGALLR